MKIAFFLERCNQCLSWNFSVAGSFTVFASHGGNKSLEPRVRLLRRFVLKSVPKRFGSRIAAAVMTNLDLIITSDTSIAHLAGALGRPAWIALKYVPDWRWMLDREDSPWYPTARLFRQRLAGDWEGVIASVSDELQRVGRASPQLVS